jgi:hypothetical protein
MATARRRFGDMAYKRNDFKDKVKECLSGAIVEFYKARLALKNGQTKWTVHWMTEVKQLVDRKLPEEIRHSVRGFTDRRKAFDEAANEIRVDDDSFRRRAEGIVKKDYGLSRVREKLDPEDTAEFWSRVAAAVDVAFAVLRSARSSR